MRSTNDNDQIVIPNPEELEKILGTFHGTRIGKDDYSMPAIKAQNKKPIFPSITPMKTIPQYKNAAEEIAAGNNLEEHLPPLPLNAKNLAKLERPPTAKSTTSEQNEHQNEL